MCVCVCVGWRDKNGKNSVFLNSTEEFLKTDKIAKFVFRLVCTFRLGFSALHEKILFLLSCLELFGIQSVNRRRLSVNCIASKVEHCVACYNKFLKVGIANQNRNSLNSNPGMSVIK